MRVALYLRVSTDDQTKNGTSLEVQDERLRAYCIARGWGVAEAYTDDGQSARTLDRPALHRLREDARQKKLDVVLIYRLDRLTRSVRDLGALLAELERRGVALVSLSESLDVTSAAGRLLVHILGSVAQWERETTAERTADALQRLKRERRVYTGETPYGFERTPDRRLGPLDHELDVVRLIYSLRRDESLPPARRTLRAIAQTLSERGIPTKKGRSTWHAQQVRYILQNDLYHDYL